jgi:hypothetical protein
VIKKPQRQRTRSDLGSRAIGWMGGFIKKLEVTHRIT